MSKEGSCWYAEEDGKPKLLGGSVGLEQMLFQG
jgi:hypothetical protein